MKISKYFVCLSADCKLSAADSGKGSRELVWQALAGRGIWLTQDGYLLCSVLSVMCSQERRRRRQGGGGGGGGRTSSPPPYALQAIRANTQG